MRNRILMVLMCISLGFGLSACGAGQTEPVNDTNIESTEEAGENGDASLENVVDISETDSETEGSSVDSEASEGKVKAVAAFYDEVIGLKDDGTQVKYEIDIPDSYTYVEEAELIGDYVYVIANGYNKSGIMCRIVYIFNTDGTLHDELYLANTELSTAVVEYEDEVYIETASYSYSEEQQEIVITYTPEDKRTLNAAEFNETGLAIRQAGYMFNNSQNSLIKALKECEGDIYAVDKNTTVVAAFDRKTGEKKREVYSPKAGSGVDIYGACAWVSEYDYENERSAVDLINLDTLESVTLHDGKWKDQPYYLKKEGNNVYYWVSDYEPAAFEKASVYEYDFETRKSRELYSAEYHVGCNEHHYTPAIDGIIIEKDGIYFRDFEEGNLVWKVYDKAAGKVENTSIVSEEYSVFKYADIEFTSIKDQFTASGNDRFYGKIEKAVIKDSVKNADKINKRLQELYENKMAQCGEVSATIDDEGFEPVSADYVSSEEAYVNSIKEIGHYLSVYYSFYTYAGGAHGTGYEVNYLFDLDTGEQKQLSEMCGIDEEAFKKLVAEKMVAFWKTGSDQFFTDYDEYPEEEESIYADAYQYAGFDMMYHFTEDGLDVAYSPYLFGPYAAGEIGVHLTYDELGINMN